MFSLYIFSIYLICGYASLSSILLCQYRDMVSFSGTSHLFIYEYFLLHLVSSFIYKCWWLTPYQLFCFSSSTKSRVLNLQLVVLFKIIEFGNLEMKTSNVVLLSNCSYIWYPFCFRVVLIPQHTSCEDNKESQPSVIDESYITIANLTWPYWSSGPLYTYILQHIKNLLSSFEFHYITSITSRLV